GAAFAIPSALGAQEGGLVLLCAVFGIPAEQAVALSLVKRAADLALGVPGLVGWQLLGWGHLMPNHAQSARLRARRHEMGGNELPPPRRTRAERHPRGKSAEITGGCVDGGTSRKS